jgi:hypothetical protein
MDEFEHLNSCHDKWGRLPVKKRTRKQQTVVDVMNLVAAVEGDGFAGWWESVCRFGNADRDVSHVIESFRFAGLDSFADMIAQTVFCRDVVAAGIAGKGNEFQFSPEQEQTLGRFDRHFSEKGPDAREALLQFCHATRPNHCVERTGGSLHACFNS